MQQGALLRKIGMRRSATIEPSPVQEASPPAPAPPRAPLRRGLGLGRPWDHMITIALCIYFASRAVDIIGFTLYALGALGVFASIWYHE